LRRIYDFLRSDAADAAAPNGAAETSGTAAAHEVEAAVRSAADPSAAIASRCTPGEPGADATCVAAMEMLISALGAEAANAALRFQAHGGVFLAGGVTAKLAARLGAGSALRDAYLGKGRSVAAYEGCPLYLVTREGDELALDGAWECARRAFQPVPRPPPASRGVPLEVCVDCVASAVAAERGGASRLELCANLLEGGTTPSAGLLRVVLRTCSLPVHAMVRPRGGDFLYSEAELEVMREEIREIKRAGAAGVVLGALRADGSVDELVLRELVSLAAPLPLTFHRAVDVAADPVAAVEACVRCGVRRVLSSGGAPDATAGAAVLRRMVAAAGGRLTVAAAGGLSEGNAASIAAASGADEVHGSLRCVQGSAMLHRPETPVYMGSQKVHGRETEFETKVADRERVAAAVAALQTVYSGRRPAVE